MGYRRELRDKRYLNSNFYVLKLWLKLEWLQNAKVQKKLNNKGLKHRNGRKGLKIWLFSRFFVFLQREFIKGGVKGS